MDEYLRDRYKKPVGGAAKPMFPVNPRPQAQPQRRPEPAPVPHHQPAPASYHAAPVRDQPVAGRQARPKRRFGLVKIMAVLLIMGLAAGGSYYYLKYFKSPTPLPKQLVKSASFPVYYPSKLPGGYTYQAGTANNPGGLFTYKVADGSNGVVVTEQPKPANFNPSQLPNFKSVDVSGATAVIGTSSNVMTIVYATSTTLINMTAVNGISQADMIAIAQSLAAIKQ